MNAQLMQCELGMVQELAERYDQPQDECTIYGIPVAEIPDELLRGLLRWVISENRRQHEDHMSSWRMMREIREAAR